MPKPKTFETSKHHRHQTLNLKRRSGATDSSSSLHSSPQTQDKINTHIAGVLDPFPAARVAATRFNRRASCSFLGLPKSSRLRATPRQPSWPNAGCSVLVADKGKPKSHIAWCSATRHEFRKQQGFRRFRVVPGFGPRHRIAAPPSGLGRSYREEERGGGPQTSGWETCSRRLSARWLPHVSSVCDSSNMSRETQAAGISRFKVEGNGLGLLPAPRASLALRSARGGDFRLGKSKVQGCT